MSTLSDKYLLLLNFLKDLIIVQPVVAQISRIQYSSMSVVSFLETTAYNVRFFDSGTEKYSATVSKMEIIRFEGERQEKI